MGSSSNNDNKATQPRMDRRWYFPKEEVLNSPSCRMGLTPEKELSYRQQSASLIQEIGQRLQVGQLVINTGIVYMHRFYMMFPFQKFHRNAMTPACVFLAAKVEEQPRKLEHLLKVTNVVIHGSENGPEPTSDEFVTRASEIMVNENILLQTLGFDVAIDHPHTHVVKCCQLVRATKDLAQTSYFMATNSLHLTTMCLQYKPTVVACLCIYLVCKWSRYEVSGLVPIQRQTEGRDWFYYVDADVTLELLSSLCNDFLKILDKCPLKVKKLIKNAQNAQARMVASGGGGVIGGPPPRSSLGGDQHKQLSMSHSMGNSSALSMSGMTRNDGNRSSINIKEYGDNKREKERRERERIALEAAANNPYSFNPQAMRASANLPPQISSSSQHPPYGVPNFKFSTANRNSVHSSHHKHEQPQQNQQQQHQHRMVPKHNAPADQHQFFQESKRQSMDSTMTSKTRPSLPPHHQNTVKHEIQPKMEQKPFPKFEQKPNVRSSDVIKSERNLPVKNERNVPQFKEEIKKEEDPKVTDGSSFIFSNCDKSDFNLGNFMPFSLGDAPPEDIFDTNDSMGHLAPATHHKGLSPGGGDLSNTPPVKHSKGDPKGASSLDGRPGQGKSREQLLEEHNKKLAAQKQQQQQLFEQQQRELLQQKMQQEQAEKQKQMELKKQQQMEQQRQEEIRKKEQEMKRQEQIRLEKEREAAKRKELQRKEMELQKQQEMRLLAEKQAQQLKQQQELQRQREEQQAALLRQQQQQLQQQELLRKQLEVQRQQELARQKEEEKERLHRKKKEEKELLKMQEMQRKSAYDTNSIGEILSTVTGKSNLLTPKASSKRRSKEILETSPLMMNTGILSPGTKPYRPQPDSPSHPSQVALYHRNSGKVVKNLTKQLDEPDQIATPPPPSYPLKRTYSEALESDTRPDLFGNNYSVGESSKVQPDDSTVANPSKKHKSEHKHHKEKKKHKNKEKDKHKDREHKKEKKHKKNKDKDKERKRSSIPEAEFATPEAPIKLTIKIGNSDTPQVTPSSTGLKMKISKGGIIKKPEDSEFDYNKSKRRKESPEQSKYSKAGLAKTLDYGHHDQPPPPSGSYSRYQ